MLKNGDQAPEFTLEDQNGNKVTLSDLKGKKLLIYFYPKANTPGCAIQSCSVSKAKNIFEDYNCSVLGVSPDKPEKQKKFDNNFSLGFPLLCDTDHKVAEAYGVWGQKSFMGKKFMGISRSSFLIDEEGKIIEAWYCINPADTTQYALKVLKSSISNS